MFTPHGGLVAALIILLCAATPLAADDSIGKAVHIKTEVTGAGGELAVDDPVHQDERIRTSKSGLGQFVFRDGTKLAVGWGSSVVVDKFIFDGSNSVKKLTLKAAKGTFRWISGNSNHSAYEILTPAGTIGVRGTVFDFYIGADGTTAVVLLSGAASFCGGGACRQLTRRCDFVMARPNGRVSETRRVDRTIFNTLGNTKALPFLSGNQQLPAIGGSGACGLRRVADIKRQNDVEPEPKKNRATPKKPDKERKPIRYEPPGDHDGKPRGRDGPRDGRDNPVVDRDKPPSDRERPQGDREERRDGRDSVTVDRETPPSDHDGTQSDRDGSRDGRDSPPGDNHRTPTDTGGDGGGDGGDDGGGG